MSAAEHKRQREATLAWRAAQRWVEVLLSRGEVDAARAWLSMLDGIDDEGALGAACSRTNTMFSDVWGAFRSTVFRNGKRVLVPAIRCTSFWDKKRPCTLAPNHPGDCEPEDVSIDRQHENMRAFEREYGAIVAAVVGAPLSPEAP